LDVTGHAIRGLDRLAKSAGVDEICEITSQPALARKYGLTDQLERASVSIMSNIAEGFERGSANEFHHVLFIAKASCAEVRSLLFVLVDVGFINRPRFTAVWEQTEEVGRVIGGLRASVNEQRTSRSKVE
jgi:four helix bundle protein